MGMFEEWWLFPHCSLYENWLLYCLYTRYNLYPDHHILLGLSVSMVVPMCVVYLSAVNILYSDQYTLLFMMHFVAYGCSYWLFHLFNLLSHFHTIHPFSCLIDSSLCSVFTTSSLFLQLLVSLDWSNVFKLVYHAAARRSASWFISYWSLFVTVLYADHSLWGG